MAKKANEEKFEAAYNKLEKILDDLESNIEKKSLDEVIKAYQEGLRLIKICKEKIEEAELKIEKINTVN